MCLDGAGTGSQVLAWYWLRSCYWLMAALTQVTWSLITVQFSAPDRDVGASLAFHAIMVPVQLAPSRKVHSGPFACPPPPVPKLRFACKAVAGGTAAAIVVANGSAIIAEAVAAQHSVRGVWNQAGDCGVAGVSFV